MTLTKRFRTLIELRACKYGTSLSLIGLGTVAALAECSSIEEVERACVPDLWGEELIPARSVKGFLRTHVFEFFDISKRASSREQTRKILEAAREAFRSFQAVLLQPTEENILPFAELLALAFDERWQQKCSSANRLLLGEESPLRFAEALRVVGPSILSSTTAASIPWDVLETIAKGEALRPAQRTSFHRWVEELRGQQGSLSPLLMLSVCESAASKAFGEGDPRDSTKEAFRILFELYRAGLKWLVGADAGALDRIPLGLKITSIRFPEASDVQAYEDPSSADSMIMVSPAPLYLGIWLNSLAASRSSIPSIRLELIDGRFLKAERLLSSCSDLFWEGPGVSTGRDRRLLDGIAELCARVLRSGGTPLMNFDRLFVTFQFSVCSLQAFEDKWPFTCLPAIELFIVSICRGDGERIRTVLDRSGFWESKTVQLYREIISDFCFKITDRQVAAIIEQFELPPSLFSVLLPWVREIGACAEAALQAIREENFTTSATPKSLAKMVLRLQKKDGFVALLPANLFERILRELSAK